MYSRNLHIRLLLLLLVLLVSAPAIMAQKNRKKQFTVVIDPGHGGIDPGALGKRAKEKDVNMS